ncbi:MAG: hypothetical protein PHT79_09345 [Syntrophomonadaceae bacterium]|nr:hypothetical protein [Syntrophomonadaceae bacterium]MDD4549946.1 hypothetical protein [Syntrophomonadaceae bacterium]
MQKRWKGNFMKVPRDIYAKLDQIDTKDVMVASIKSIPLHDIKNSFYRHLSIIWSGKDVTYNNSIIPLISVGRYSKYNINGRSIPLKQLPKVEASFTADVPNFGDWSKGYHDITWTRKVYQREQWLPRNLSINIELLNISNNNYTFKFYIDCILNKEEPDFLEDLLYHCNLLQENTGTCSIFAADANDSNYVKTLYVDWELLPPGTKNFVNNVNSITTTIKHPSDELINTVKERLDFFETLKPIKYIRGKNKFNLYFGALFNNNLVLLENIRYGNAIYIFTNNWEEFSKLSRIQLLKIKSKDIKRITHSSNWKYNVKIALDELS